MGMKDMKKTTEDKVRDEMEGAKTTIFKLKEEAKQARLDAKGAEETSAKDVAAIKSQSEKSLVGIADKVSEEHDAFETAKAKHEKAQNKALHKIKVEHTKAKQALLEKHEKAIQQATSDADSEADDETNQAVAKMQAEEAAVQQEMLDAEAKAKE